MGLVILYKNRIFDMKRTQTFEPLAIVGMSCLFPKAQSLQDYWANIKEKVDCIKEVPETHWKKEDYYNEDKKCPDHVYTTNGGFLDPVDFNPAEWGIAPSDLDSIDTSQLLSLVVAKGALADAGYANKDFDRELFLAFAPRGLRMNFDFKVRLNSRAQQLDTFNKMELDLGNDKPVNQPKNEEEDKNKMEIDEENNQIENIQNTAQIQNNEEPPKTNEEQNQDQDTEMKDEKEGQLPKEEEEKKDEKMNNDQQPFEAGNIQEKPFLMGGLKFPDIQTGDEMEKDHSSEENPVPTEDTFQLKIFQSQCSNKKGENIVISPLSIYQILSLTSNGAKGDTLNQMVSTLKMQNLDELKKSNEKMLDFAKKSGTFSIANIVMARETPKAEFVNAAKNYEALINKLTTAEEINKWCSEKTKGKISKIIEDIPPETQLILLNAVYFKDEWNSKKFENYLEGNVTFHNENGTPSQGVEMMKMKEKIDYFENFEHPENHYYCAGLDYSHDGMKALIILPPKNMNINDFIKNLTSQELHRIINDGLSEMEFTLYLPKFKIEYETKLKEDLTSLGMEDAFKSEKADFSEIIPISGNEKPYISEVTHKTFIEVNEKGTEAAAVTKVDIDLEIFAHGSLCVSYSGQCYLPDHLFYADLPNLLE